MKTRTRSFWGTPPGIAATGLIAIGGNFLYIEHRQYPFDALPCLLLGACLLLYGFMHRATGMDPQVFSTHSANL